MCAPSGGHARRLHHRACTTATPPPCAGCCTAGQAPWQSHRPRSTFEAQPPGCAQRDEHQREQGAGQGGKWEGGRRFEASPRGRSASGIQDGLGAPAAPGQLGGQQPGLWRVRRAHGGALRSALGFRGPGRSSCAGHAGQALQAALLRSLHAARQVAAVVDCSNAPQLSAFRRANSPAAPSRGQLAWVDQARGQACFASATLDRPSCRRLSLRQGLLAFTPAGGACCTAWQPVLTPMRRASTLCGTVLHTRAAAQLLGPLNARSGCRQIVVLAGTAA